MDNASTTFPDQIFKLEIVLRACAVPSQDPDAPVAPPKDDGS
jgi:hypothetical protein